MADAGMTWNLSECTAVVTGGARGLGRAIAERLQRGGARIVVVDLESTLGAVELPSGWLSEAIDLGADDAADRLRAVGDRLGTVEIVVANAGVVPPWRATEELEATEWRNAMQVNIWGVAATLSGLAPALKRSGRGSAVLMASINGYKAHPRQMLYTATKHAVVGIMRAAALDLGAGGVRVNAIAPGPIATEALLSRITSRHQAGGPGPEIALRELAATNALGRLATESEVAETAYWLASGASSGVTGQLFPVEAGMG